MSSPVPSGLPDRLPALVQRFVVREDAALELLREVLRHVEWVLRPYPDAWFVLGRRDPAAAEDLANRVFTTCARVVKGRFPYQGRRPFPAFVEERFDGGAMRYHAFYARRSITRELMHGDYACNVARDPVLRWHADLHRAVGEALRAFAEPEGVGRALRWRLADAGGPRRVYPLLALPGLLREKREEAVEALVREALHLGGPLFHVQITRLLTEVLPQPVADAVEDASEAIDLSTRATVRAAVMEAWGRLGAADQALLVEVVRGATFQEIAARHPRFRDPATLSRAIGSCNDVFIAQLARAWGEEARPSVPPRAMLERMYEVLIGCLPGLHPEDAPAEAA